MKKYRLICGLLVAGILVNACSSHTIPAQSQSQGNEPLPTFSIGLGFYEKEAEVKEAEVSEASSCSSSGTSQDRRISGSSCSSSGSGSDFWEGLLTFAGLALGLAATAHTTFSEVEAARETGWTGEYQPEWDRMTRSQAIEYISEHPETWTPVYVVPAE